MENKLTRDVKEMILTALENAGGAEYLTEKARTHPVAFLALLGRVLPLQLASDSDQALVIDFRWRDPEPEQVTIEVETIDQALIEPKRAVSG